MSETICGIDCSGCSFKENCGGCSATSGHPFGSTWQKNTFLALFRLIGLFLVLQLHIQMNNILNLISMVVKVLMQLQSAGINRCSRLIFMVSVLINTFIVDTTYLMIPSS